MHLRHLVISSLAALTIAGPASPLCAAESAEGDASQTFQLDTTDKPLETVLQWISRRAGVNVVCNEPDAPRVTMRLINITWQEAVEQIATRYDFVVVKKSDRLWELTKPPKVRMQFEDARLSVVLSAIANQAGVNIVISDDVDSARRLTMTLNGVPWQEALDVIVKATGYAWVKGEYNIVRVVSPDKLQKDLQTRIFRINYHQDSKALAALIAKVGSGKDKDSADLRVEVDERSNTLVVTAPPPTLDSVAKTIAALDGRTRQVQIEMKFVEFSNTDAQRLGFNPVNMAFDLKGIGHFAPSFTPFSDTFGGGVNYNTRVNGNVPSSSGNFSADFAYEAIATLQSSELLQAPQLRTLDNTPAMIEIGREIRYAESTISESGSIGSQQVTLKEATGSPVKDGIKITVTPHITSDGFVSIKLEAANEKATLIDFTNGKQSTDPFFNAIKLPQKDTTKLSNTMMAADGATVVIGGILNNLASEETRQIPVLGSIPVLGWLFKKRNDSVEQRNLTIFITPHIIPISDDKSEVEQMRVLKREQLSGLDLKPIQSDANKTTTGP